MNFQYYRYFFKDAVLDGGIPFNKANGMAAFEYYGTDPRFSTIFNQGMQGHSTVIMKRLLEQYKGFDNVKLLVDVGGGIGASLNMIISKHPHISGINFDLPLVIADAPAYKGMEHMSGDMFRIVPTGDAIFMKCEYRSNGLHDHKRIKCCSEHPCLKRIRGWKYRES